MTFDQFANSDPGIAAFHQDYITEIRSSRGSRCNHQAWEGGYVDHIVQCFYLAQKVYSTLSELCPLPFTLFSAWKVIYFHDIEKIWAYSAGGLPDGFDKWEWYTGILPVRYNVHFTEDELNALRYVHGEGGEYRKDGRVMNELAAFCHSIDVMSARIFHNKKCGDLKWNS